MDCEGGSPVALIKFFWAKDNKNIYLSASKFSSKFTLILYIYWADLCQE